jgi:hypothetical protein
LGRFFNLLDVASERIVFLKVEKGNLTVAFDDGEWLLNHEPHPLPAGQWLPFSAIAEAALEETISLLPPACAR